MGGGVCRVKEQYTASQTQRQRQPAFIRGVAARKQRVVRTDGRTECRWCIRSSEHNSPAPCDIHYLYQRSWTSWCDVMWQVIRCRLLPPLDGRTEHKKVVSIWLTRQMFPKSFEFIPRVHQNLEVHQTPCQSSLKGICSQVATATPQHFHPEHTAASARLQL